MYKRKIIEETPLLFYRQLKQYIFLLLFLGEITYWSICLPKKLLTKLFLLLFLLHLMLSATKKQRSQIYNLEFHMLFLLCKGKLHIISFSCVLTCVCKGTVEIQCIY